MGSRREGSTKGERGRIGKGRKETIKYRREVKRQTAGEEVMKKETERRNGAGGEFINVSVHFVKLIVKLVTRFDDRYAEAIFLSSEFGI